MLIMYARTDTGKYTEVWRSSESSLLPRLRGIAGSAVGLLSSFRDLPSTEKRAEVRCNSVGQGLGKRLTP